MKPGDEGHDLTIRELPCGCIRMRCCEEHTIVEICAAIDIDPRSLYCEAHRQRQASWERAREAQIEQFVWQSLYEHPITNPDATVEDRERHRSLELGKLRIAEPVFVTDEMCALVEAALESFQSEQLLEQDLLTRSGFVLFERALSTNDLGLPLCAFAWTSIKWPATAPRGYGIHFSFYAPTDFLVASRRVGEPEIVIFHTAEYSFGVTPDRNEDVVAAQVSLRLMKEFRPARRSSSHERPSRATRKRAKRAGLDEADVLVVRLRRERQANEHLGGVANYSHRFMVHGHWRDQWYPTLDAHRQVWIAPYVKGPADKPFKPPSGRAFLLHR